MEYLYSSSAGEVLNLLPCQLERYLSSKYSWLVYNLNPIQLGYVLESVINFFLILFARYLFLKIPCRPLINLFAELWAKETFELEVMNYVMYDIIIEYI